MFNSGYKKEALKALERANEAYSNQYKKTIDNAEKLHNLKEQSVQILKSVEDYYNSLANKPRQFMGIISILSERRKKFDKEVNDINWEGKKSDHLGKRIAGIGFLTGFGQALIPLALTGPIGWTIGGATILLANKNNKEVAHKAEIKTREIKEETFKIEKFDTKICAEKSVIASLNSGIRLNLSSLSYLPKDYLKFTYSNKDLLAQMINSAEALSKRVEYKIS